MSVVAVTGASGHIGANLVRALIEQGKKVRVLEHKNNLGYKDLNVEIVKGDVCDPDCLNQLFNDVDVVYHLAAKIYLGKKRDLETEEINILGTRNVASTCLKKGVRRLVHFSSIHSLSPFPINGLVDEKRPLNLGPKAAWYDLSKAAAEKEIQKAIQEGLDAVILNPSGVIGPNDFNRSAMGQVIQDIIRKKFLLICQGGFNWVDVRDVAACAIAAANRGRKGERYLLSGEWMTIGEMVKMISNNRSYCCTLPIDLALFITNFFETSKFTTASIQTLQHYRYINNEKAKKELGYLSRPIHQTLQDTVSWLNSFT